MMDLMKENEENKKREASSIITGVVTIIASCSLIVIAALYERLSYVYKAQVNLP